MKKQNLLSLILAGACLLATGCKDELPLPTPEATEAGKTVPVTFTIGIADEQDGYDRGEEKRTRSTDPFPASAQGFHAEVRPDTGPRAGTMPDKIYKLYVLQFDESGTWKGGKLVGDVDPGTSLTMGLATLNKCQLLFIALGSNSGISLSTGQSLSYYQSQFANMNNCNITGFKTDESDISKHPYVLYLPCVNVTAAGIESPDTADGTGHDVRILLKRLAAKLTLNWNFNVPDYTLTEVRLSQVSGTIPNGSPNHAKGCFYFYPTRNNDKDQTYPTPEKEYVDYFRLKDSELTGAKGSFAIWMPASVRGTSSKVTAPQHRNKDNAPDGACYVEFVAEKKESGEVKDRIFYRVYLGGAAVNDFNIKENTNYTWKVEINSANVADPRITRLDMTPVKSNNQRNTSNCFMVIPGTDFWFNPYKHEAGTSGWNDELVNSPASSPGFKTQITSVKVLWQSRDNGTSGELVMGRYIDKDNHQNLVNYENLDDIAKAKIFVKVPVSQGGNAVIAAYNGNTILWSWHLWITDYIPDRMKLAGGTVDDRYKAAQSGTINGTVHKYDSKMFAANGVYENMVMMDRDIGAKKGGFPGYSIGKNFSVQDVVNTYGLLYQWGRKDPFFSSADGTDNEINVIYNGDGTPLEIEKKSIRVTIATSIQNPLVFYAINNNDWCTTSNGTRWNKNSNTNNFAPGVKTIYDPSPEGWKIPVAFQNNQTLSNDNIQANSIFTNYGLLNTGGCAYNYNPAVSNSITFTRFMFYLNETWIGSVASAGNNPKGGRLFLTDKTTTDNGTIHTTVWYPTSAERYYSNGNLLRSGSITHTYLADWFPSGSQGSSVRHAGLMAAVPNGIEVNGHHIAFGWPTRCIQDNGN